MDNNRRPVLNWGHPDLQKVFEAIPPSGALLLVAENDGIAERLWDLSQKTMAPSADRAGIRSMLIKWEERQPDEWLNRVKDARSDLAIVDLRAVSPAHEAEVLSALETWPCAIIALMQRVPRAWPQLFDYCLQLDEKKAVGLSATAKDVQQWPFTWQTPSQPTKPALNASRPLVSLRGFSASRVAALVEAFPDIDWGDEKRAFTATDFAVLMGEWSNAHIRHQVEEASKTCVAIVGFETGYREEDRIGAYQSGASFVLPPQFSNRELGALLRTHARHTHTSENSEADEALASELKQFRRGKSWVEGQEEQIVRQYGNLLTLQQKKAESEGRHAGVIVIRIPEAPRELTGGKWSQLLGNLFVDHISANLRRSDISLIYRQYIVILSHSVNHLSATAIHRRLEVLASEIPVAPPQVHELAAGEKASDFLRALLGRL